MKGALLINLGSPDSPDPKDVKRYLGEFLMDKRVIIDQNCCELFGKRYHLEYPHQKVCKGL